MTRQPRVGLESGEANIDAPNGVALCQMPLHERGDNTPSDTLPACGITVEIGDRDSGLNQELSQQIQVGPLTAECLGGAALLVNDEQIARIAQVATFKEWEPIRQEMARLFVMTQRTKTFRPSSPKNIWHISTLGICPHKLSKP
ncbi:MAG: hypothetical protein ABI947_02490 [Chloroflexota bacterium]